MLVSSIARLSATKSMGNVLQCSKPEASTFNGGNKLFNNNGLLQHDTISNFLSKHKKQNASAINYLA
ncbi:MAG: hypothetical protein LKG27_06455 [Clostridiaceae bacterium]|jgi:hypothetical protein|nr:hypothetical protein [Clostridiaceae bacterium]